jgi:hypothetical protein
MEYNQVMQASDRTELPQKRKTQQTTLLFVALMIVLWGFAAPHLTRYFTDRRMFSENPIVQENAPIKQFLGIDAPNGAHNMNTAFRQGKSKRDGVILISFFARTALLKEFFHRLGVTLLPDKSKFDDHIFEDQINGWGCQSSVRCPIPWWKNETAQAREYYNSITPINFFITSDRVSSSESKVNILGFKN